jgi:hypothetical protein
MITILLEPLSTPAVVQAVIHLNVAERNEFLQHPRSTNVMPDHRRTRPNGNLFVSALNFFNRPQRERSVEILADY